MTIYRGPGTTGIATALNTENFLELVDINVTVQAYDVDTTKNDVSNTFVKNQVISVTDNTNAALRITQLGSANAIVVEDSTNPDSSPFVVTATGNVGIGTDSPTTRLDVRGNVSIINTAEATLTLGTASSNFTILSSENDYTTFGISGGGTGLAIIHGDEVTVFENATGNVGIGTGSPATSAILDVQSTTKGVRMPNMTTTQKNALASPVAGLMVFDTDLLQIYVYTGTEWIADTADQNVFSSIAVAGQPTITADSATDTLTFIAGTTRKLATIA